MLLRALDVATSPHRNMPAQQHAQALEERVMLSNLILQVDGDVIFVGGSEVNDLEVSSDGKNYTFEDTTGTAVNAAGGDDTYDINSFRGGFEGLDIVNAAGVDTINVNGDVGATAVDNFVRLRSENVNLGAEINTLGQAVTVEGLITLTAATTIGTSSSGTITLDGTVAGGGHREHHPHRGGHRNHPRPGRPDCTGRRRHTHW